MTSTSSPRSCSFSARAALLPLIVLLAAAPPARADDASSPAELPLESEGQLDFSVDVSCFRAAGGSTDVEVYATIGNDQIEFVEETAGDPLVGALRLEISLLDGEDNVAFSEETVLEPEAESELDAGDRAIVQSVRETVTVPPGLYRLKVELTDENALRTGLLNRLRGAHRAGRVEGDVEVRAFDDPELSLSDLTLIRAWRGGREAGFGRHGVDFDANPSRLYGLVLPAVRFYVEVYPGPDHEPGDSYLVQIQVLDGAGVPRAERTLRAVPDGDLLALADEVPLGGNVPAGSYDLDVTVLRERSRRTVRSRERFEVIWAVASWGKDRETVRQEMALIMTESQYQTLRGMAPGAQEVYLAEFWHDLDPDPSTPENEVLEEFRRRVRYADREFRSTLNRGIQTDRGRVFVRYGRPDDIVYEYSSSSFGIDGSVERVADPAERATLRSRPSASFLEADEFREGDVSDVAEQRGGANVKAKQLEIWTYDGTGYPLTDHVDRGPRSHRGLKFIFADEMGNGNYTLIGSSGATIY